MMQWPRERRRALERICIDLRSLGQVKFRVQQLNVLLKPLNTRTALGGITVLD